jgi:hypothetical protein
MKHLLVLSGNFYYPLAGFLNILMPGAHGYIPSFVYCGKRASLICPLELNVIFLRARCQIMNYMLCMHFFLVLYSN